METILIVEDDFEFASHMRSLLEADGLHVIHEPTAETAIVVLQDTAVDLVITDMVMADRSGQLTFVSGLLLIAFVALNEQISPQVIAVTGLDWATSPFAALPQGLVNTPVNVLEKPINDSELRSRVHELLGKRRENALQAERQIKTQRELLRTRNTLETTQDAIFWISVDGNVLFANESACRLTGYSQDALDALPLADLDVGIPSLDAFRRTLLETLRTGEGKIYETSFRRTDGESFPVEVAAHLHQFDDERFIGLSVRDISERRWEEQKLLAAKQAVEESEKRFRSLANSSSALFWITEADTSCSWLNDRWLQYCGKSLEEQTGDQWLSTVHPDDREPSGKIYLDAVKTQTEFSLSYRLRRHDGMYRWHIANGSPRLAEDGQFLGYVGISYDDHDRMESQIELKESQSALEASMEDLAVVNRELEHFAYVASHDLKQPLRGIFGYASWINEDAESLLPAESKEHLKQIGVLADRMNSLLDDLLTYAKSGRRLCQPESLAISALIDSVREILSPPKKMVVEYVGPDVSVVLPRIELEQVFRNIIGNAIKHHDRSDGKVTIDLEITKSGTRFQISDDGPGIPTKYQEQVFGIYQKLKSRDEVEGSGMGLSIARKIVQSRGGTIEITSGDGRGTTFEIFWPFGKTETDDRT